MKRDLWSDIQSFSVVNIRFHLQVILHACVYVAERVDSMQQYSIKSSFTAYAHISDDSLLPKKKKSKWITYFYFLRRAFLIMVEVSNLFTFLSRTEDVLLQNRGRPGEYHNKLVLPVEYRTLVLHICFQLLQRVLSLEIWGSDHSLHQESKLLKEWLHSWQDTFVAPVNSDTKLCDTTAETSEDATAAGTTVAIILPQPFTTWAQRCADDILWRTPSRIMCTSHQTLVSRTSLWST